MKRSVRDSGSVVDRVFIAMRVHVLLFDAGSDSEGIHSLEIAGRTVVLLFENPDDAERYAGLLEAQDFPVPTVESLEREDVELFCRVYEDLDPGCCVLAESDGQLLGSCFYHPRPDLSKARKLHWLRLLQICCDGLYPIPMAKWRGEHWVDPANISHANSYGWRAILS